MNNIPRLYTDIVRRHLEHDRQMLFLSGPRQVGKTTICENLASYSLNWDNAGQRMTILGGEEKIAAFAELDRARAVPPVLVLDELHHFDGWKRLLKFFLIFTGNASTSSSRGQRDSTFTRKAVTA